MSVPKVLLISDRTIKADGIDYYMRLLGYTSLRAEDCASGRKIAVDRRPDLIILDRELINCLDCLKTLKQPPIQYIPVALISGHGKGDDIAPFFEAGLTDYFFGDDHRSVFEARIKNILTQSQLQIDKYQAEKTLALDLANHTSDPGIFSSEQSSLPPSVFISYSHTDEPIKDELLKHLKVLGPDRIHCWHDRLIGMGDDWNQSITSAMNYATVAVLIISAAFLTSDFIITQEIPFLLERQSRGLKLLPILASPCSWKHVPWLAPLQLLPRDGRALSSGDPHQLAHDLAEITDVVHECLKPSSSP